MACWDITGKEKGKPVYELLDGLVRPREIKCRFSMGAYPPERVRNTVPDLVARGFHTIKVKVGQSIEKDVERVALVRELIGPDRDIIIDANCGYSPKDAIEAARQMEPYNVVLFEQPTPRDDYEGIAEVRQNVSMPVMADDMVFTFNQARECLRHDAVDVISIYPGKCGGIRKCRNIATMAAEHGVACSIGSNLELDVGTAAMCHLVVGTPNMQVERVPGDILGPAYHEVPVVKNPLSIKGPIVTTPDGPGWESRSTGASWKSTPYYDGVGVAGAGPKGSPGKRPPGFRVAPTPATHIGPTTTITARRSCHSNALVTRHWTPSRDSRLRCATPATFSPRRSAAAEC
jgi:muconate cycloisomerase